MERRIINGIFCVTLIICWSLIMAALWSLVTNDGSSRVFMAATVVVGIISVICVTIGLCRGPR